MNALSHPVVDALRPRNWPVWALPLLLTPVVLGGSFGAQDRASEDRHGYSFHEIDGFGVGLLVAGLVSLLVRRRHPQVTLAVVGLAEVLWFLRAYPFGPVVFLLAVALFAAVLAGHRLLAWIGTYATLTGYLVLAQLIGVPHPERGRADQLFPVDRPTLAGTTIVLAVTLVILLGAELVRIQSERLAEAQTKRREEERRRASEERLRIARELHDVLAHNISMINVQAGVALHLMDERPEQARTALAAIKEASKEALTEMRSVIGVLRAQGETAPRAPAAGLARLPELLARARSAGLLVHTEIELPDAPLPAGVDLAAFRIVQESLTNVTRHAGPGPVTVRVHLGYGERGLSVRIEDDGRGAPLLADHAGNGLHGMRERAGALGGEFAAGPRPGGGFQVTALLPVDVPAEPAGSREEAERR